MCCLEGISGSITDHLGISYLHAVFFRTVVDTSWQQYGHSNCCLVLGTLGGGGSREWQNMLAIDVPPMEVAALEEVAGLNCDSTKLVALAIDD
jgi:hypothetical protein